MDEKQRKISDDDPPDVILNSVAANRSPDQWTADSIDELPVESAAQDLLADCLTFQQTLKTETTLSKRETTVIALTKYGLSIGAIALTLWISESHPHDAEHPSDILRLVENHYQRAKTKYETAVNTVSILDPIFDTQK